MASSVFKMIKATIKGPRQVFTMKYSQSLLFDINYMTVRHRVTTDTGAFLPQPAKTPFGIIRILLTVLPGLYLGATISKEAAAFLEENDIFVPDEDDDED